MGSVTAARVAAPTLLDVIPSFQRHLRAEMYTHMRTKSTARVSDDYSHRLPPPFLMRCVTSDLPSLLPAEEAKEDREHALV